MSASSNYRGNPAAEAEFQKWLESQSGYTGGGAKQDWWNNYGQNLQQEKSFQNIFNPEDKTFSISSGSLNEKGGRIEGLERAKVLTGQNPFEIGQDYQEAYGNIKKRTTNADTGSELLRASKAGAVADARNELQKAGVKGGAAMQSVSQIERQKAYDVNNQLADVQRKAEQDYLNAAKANANFTQASEMNYGAMAAGKDVQAPPSYSNGFGTVICTELFLQGRYTKEVYEADQIYGVEMAYRKPYVYWGYRLWADPVVKLMRKSKAFSNFVAFFALPWAENMAGRKNRFGAFISFVGEPICGLIGKLYYSTIGVEDVHY